MICHRVKESFLAVMPLHGPKPAEVGGGHPHAGSRLAVADDRRKKHIKFQASPIPAQALCSTWFVTTLFVNTFVLSFVVAP